MTTSTITTLPIPGRTATPADVGLDQVNNTADVNKPVSTAQAAAIAAAVAGVSGGGGGGGAVSSVAGRTGAVTLAVADVSGAAPLASPTFTGTPAGPTAAAGTNTTQLATTAFVLANATGVGGGVSSVNSRAGAVTLTASDVGLANVNNTADSNKPVSTAQAIAIAAAAATGPVTSVAGRTGSIVISAPDVQGTSFNFSTTTAFTSIHNNGMINAANGTIVTLASGLGIVEATFNLASSGSVSFSPASGVTVNGGTSTVTVSGTGLFSLVATSSNTFLVTSPGSGATGVPTSTTLTVNGTTLDLSTNRVFPGGMTTVGFATADGTITDSVATVQTFSNGSYTLAANALGPGDELVVRGRGSFSTTGTVVKTIGVNIGGVQFAINSDSTSTTTGSFEFEARLFARTSSTQRGSQRYTWGSPGINGNPPLSLTVDLTTSLTIAVTGQFATAGSGSQNMVLQVCTVRIEQA